MAFIVGLTIFLIVFGITEYQLHVAKLKRIAIRVHVNGTRGKSSVTRLIAAGLRAGGIKTVAKTTGTSPRMIFEDGSEAEIKRIGGANIKEQIPLIRFFSKKNPNALVIECMALQPQLQKITEEMLVKSTIGVITNARADHLDVMGPEVKDVAIALARTIPYNGVIFTAEKPLKYVFDEVAQQRNTHVKLVHAHEVTDDEMHGFSYIAWKSNVALALAVCEHLGINRELALKGMHEAIPDPGVLKIYRIHFFQKEIEFVNAFAANDPESTYLVSQNLGIGQGDRKFAIFIVNCRADKIQRSEQLAQLISGMLPGNLYVLTGEYTRAVYDQAVRLGQKEEKIIDLGGKNAEEIFEIIVEFAETKTIVVGIGNVVGLGQDIVNFFASRGEDEKGSCYFSTETENEHLFV